MMYLTWSLLTSAPASAREWTVIQAGQMFLQSEAEPRAAQIQATPALGRELNVTTLDIHVGDEINFRNLDKVSHNVYGDKFDLQSQAPGTARRQKFNEPGVQMIKCAIHPKMKFRLEVKP